MIPQRELRNQNATVIDAVVAGETFLVTRNGVPVAELRPVRPETRTFVTREAILRGAGSPAPVDRARLRADLDGVVDPRL